LSPDVPLPPALNAEDNTEALSPGDSLGADLAPRNSPFTFDPSLETTPPPGNPVDGFGIGAAPEYEDLGSLKPGQTLIIYHPFAEHPPEVIDTAHLAWTRESNTYLPSGEPYAPFETRTDFEQAELFVHHNFSNTVINDQLQLNQRVSQASEQGVQTMKNAREMHKILAQAGQYQDTSSVSLLHPLEVVL